MLVGLASYLLVERFVLDIRDFGVYRVPELLAVGILLLLFVRKWPRSNLGAWVLVAYLVLGNGLWMQPTIDAFGRFSTLPLFSLPILIFFFLGLGRGLAMNLVFLAWLFLQWPMNAWDSSVYGASGLFFLVSYSIVTVICYTMEWIRRRVAEQSAEIAEKDALTGLFNRSGFLLRMEAAIGRGNPFFLVLLDLDHFRRINLTTGSLYADTLLRRVGELLCEQEGVHDVARHYGDAFVFIAECDEPALFRLVESLQNGLNIIGAHSDYNISLAASFGASLFPDHAKLGRELWNQSEMALGNAKKEGRARLRLYRDEDAQEEKKLAYLLESLRQDIQAEELEVYFQPKICVAEQKVCGMEALARWRHPQWGMVPPSTFVPLAEQYGLIIPLGEMVTRRAIEFLSTLQRSGYGDLSVSVNVSAAQLSQQNFVGNLEQLCAQHGLKPSHLYLEITESLLLHNEMGDLLAELRAAGFRLALDDFGTGYSSMSYLHRYQFDELKVDKSFTDGLLRSGREKHVFRSILELSKGLGMYTVVEGVESLPQVETIRALGAPQIQGWFFARAMPADEMLRFLEHFDYAEAVAALPSIGKNVPATA